MKIRDRSRNEIKGPESTRRYSILLRFSLAIYGFTLLLVVAFSIWTSRLLRPVADDYQFGVLAHGGVFKTVEDFWQVRSGAVTQILIIVVFTGLPLARLPWQLASSLPFLFASFLMAATGARLRGTSPSTRTNRIFTLRKMLYFLALISTWWGYWWLPALPTPRESENYAIAAAVTHWQTAVAHYVISTGLLIWLWLGIHRRIDGSWRRKYLYASVLGLTAGLNYQVFAASSFFVILLVLVAWLLLGRASLRRCGVTWLLALIGIVFGALASHFSPGSRLHAERLATPEFSFQLTNRLLFDALPTGFIDWIDAVFGWNVVLVAVVVGGVTYLSTSETKATEVKPLLWKGCILLGYSMLASIANRVSELFVYEAFWHLIGPRTIAWLGIVTLSSALGLYIATRWNGSLAKLGTALATALAILIVVMSIGLMNKQIIDRHEAWVLGPAPIYDTSDIEDPNGLVLPWWLELKEIRDTPDRALP